MARARPTVAIAIGLFGAMIASRAHAQSTSNENAELALLKQQLRSMEQKLDKLQKQTTANTNAAATANAKADARATGAANVNGAIPSRDRLRRQTWSSRCRTIDPQSVRLTIKIVLRSPADCTSMPAVTTIARIARRPFRKGSMMASMPAARELASSANSLGIGIMR